MKHALPFNRFYDIPLRAAFKLANRWAELRSATWAAGVANKMYSSLSSAVIALVFVSPSHALFQPIEWSNLTISYWCQENTSQFSLVHDVWTTKGNRFALIGVSANFIDDHWNYRTIHLSLKLVAWNKLGYLLAQPVARFLIAHGLHKKISLPSTFHFTNFVCTYSFANIFMILLYWLHVRPDHRLRFFKQYNGSWDGGNVLGLRRPDRLGLVKEPRLMLRP